MKKIAALLLVFSMLVLCSCTSKPTENKENEVTESMQTSETTKKEIKTSRNKLLPDDFPALPESAENIKTSEGSSGNSIYNSNWVRLKFTCDEPAFYFFSNTLKQAGYNGGLINIATKETYFNEGYTGLWQNGKYFVKLNGVSDGENNKKTITLDIIELKPVKPSALEKYFPLPNLPLLNDGVLNVTDSKGNTLNSDNSYPLDDGQKWSWSMKEASGYYGVTQDEFNKYVKELRAAGFAGEIRYQTVDTCPCTTLDMVCEKDGVRYGVFMLYNTLLYSLEMIYTNDAAAYGK